MYVYSKKPVKWLRSSIYLVNCLGALPRKLNRDYTPRHLKEQALKILVQSIKLLRSSSYNKEPTSSKTSKMVLEGGNWVSRAVLSSDNEELDYLKIYART